MMNKTLSLIDEEDEDMQTEDNVSVKDGPRFNESAKMTEELRDIN